jgi:hypothetical protein
MSCTDCAAARETTGLWRYYSPACLWCGARLIQRIPASCGTSSEASQRRKKVLADWMANGHAEGEIRELAKSKTLAFEPAKKEKR